MNVLQVITALHQGGAEVHLLLLAKGLHSRRITCEVAFLRSRVPGGSVDLRDAFESAGIRTHYLGCENPFNPTSGIRLRRLLATKHWDIVHSHLPRADGAAAFCKLLRPSRTWISTIHDPYDAAYSGARLIPMVAPMWRLADGLIAVSESVRQWSIDRLRIDPRSIRTIVHGIELGKRRPMPFASGAMQRARYRIGAVGRYEKRKGHETLIRAMVAIVKEFPDAQLRIAGQDPFGYSTRLRALIQSLKLDQNVHLVGFVKDKETFFEGIDVFALASLWEGFGIVVLEAMEAGKPMVVSNVSPLTDIVIPGTTGLVADAQEPESFANAIISLFRDRVRLHEMGAAGRQRVETEFSEARMIDRTLEFYQSVTRRIS